MINFSFMIFAISSDFISRKRDKEKNYRQTKL